MGFIYYCSQRGGIFLLVLWNNRLFQQSGNSRDVQLRNRSLFSSSSDPAWGVWWPQIGHLPGQNQGTMLRAAHRLFGRGGKNIGVKIFGVKIFATRWQRKKKKCPWAYYFTFACHWHCEANKQICVVWSTTAASWEELVHLLLPWADPATTIQDTQWKLRLGQLKKMDTLWFHTQVYPTAGHLSEQYNQWQR